MSATEAIGQNATKARWASPKLGWTCYGLSVSILVISWAIALSLYPGAFDWQYTVVSALASRKHNPEGGPWFAGGLGLALALLWPFVTSVWGARKRRNRLERRFILALRLGLIFGALMAVESILDPALPQRLEKTHEFLALLAFLFCYAAILGISLSSLGREKRFPWSALLLAAPIVGIGLSQFALYLGQRDLGWVDQSWRELGVPLWQSFAFWQWQALGILWIATGILGWRDQPRSRPIHSR